MKLNGIQVVLIILTLKNTSLAAADQVAGNNNIHEPAPPIMSLAHKEALAEVLAIIERHGIREQSKTVDPTIVASQIVTGGRPKITPAQTGPTALLELLGARQPLKRVPEADKLKKPVEVKSAILGRRVFLTETNEDSTEEDESRAADSDDFLFEVDKFVDPRELQPQPLPQSPNRIQVVAKNRVQNPAPRINTKKHTEIPLEDHLNAIRTGTILKKVQPRSETTVDKSTANAAVDALSLKFSQLNLPEQSKSSSDDNSIWNDEDLNVQ